MSKYDAAWRKARTAHLERTGRVCKGCGPIAKGKRVHVHHVIGIARDPEHRRLATVCPSCHEIVELLSRRGSNLSTVNVGALHSLALLKIEHGR